MKGLGGFLGTVGFVVAIVLVVLWIVGGLNKPAATSAATSAPARQIQSGIDPTVAAGFASIGNTGNQPAGNNVSQSAGTNTGNSNPPGCSNPGCTTTVSVDQGVAGMFTQNGGRATAEVAGPDGTKVGVIGSLARGQNIKGGSCIDYDGRSDKVVGATWTIHNADWSKTRSYIAPDDTSAVWQGGYTMTMYFTPCNNDPRSLG
jgi:hypothetical protein